jgi:hypothetical protein
LEWTRGDRKRRRWAKRIKGIKIVEDEGLRSGSHLVRISAGHNITNRKKPVNYKKTNLCDVVLPSPPLYFVF